MEPATLPMIIEYVAIYLRKSRDESNGTEDVLAKHERELVDFCKRQGWKYVIYKEVASSDTIEMRPEMVKLLHDVEQGLFDAVVVIDIDRLGRGNLQDQATIRRVFGNSNTLIMTPQRAYDLADEEQEVILDIESLFARFEYRMIKKRLFRGKKLGAKAGKWTNGKPPFPYVYNRENKILEINPEQLQVYNLIKDQFMNQGLSCMRIAFNLNKMGFPSPGGKYWSENAIYRLLVSEVHIGRIIFGKTQGSLHKKRNTKPFKQLPRDQWIVFENAHPAVKTLEEHYTILDLMERKKIIPKRSRKGEYILSGLIRCGLCGASMTFLANNDKNGIPSLKKCQHADPFGNRCTNRGFGSIDLILDSVMSQLQKYEESLLEQMELPNKEQAVNEPLERALQNKEKELVKLTASLDKMKELYEMGDYTRAEYLEKSDKRKREIADKENEVREIRETLGKVLTVRTVEDKVERIKKFREEWETTLSIKEKNALLKSIVSKIVYLRVGDATPNLTVHFF